MNARLLRKSRRYTHVVSGERWAVISLSDDNDRWHELFVLPRYGHTRRYLLIHRQATGPLTVVTDWQTDDPRTAPQTPADAVAIMQDATEGRR